MGSKQVVVTITLTTSTRSDGVVGYTATSDIYEGIVTEGATAEEALADYYATLEHIREREGVSEYLFVTPGRKEQPQALGTIGWFGPGAPEFAIAG